VLGNVRSLVALVALYSACFSSIALAEQRLALVIGNDAYKDLPQCPSENILNPLNRL
jgi:hypothetical protein